MKTVTAFSPGHVTGLFYVPPLPEDPLLQSSIGAGFSITGGINTKISRQVSSEEPIHILIDGIVNEAPVSRRVLKIFQEKTGIKIAGPLLIEHRSDLPHGAGFGTSGAGALGLAMTLSRLFDAGLSHIEEAQIAHMAEVDCQTGLGTVMGELTGGIKLLIKQGAPGIGETKPIPFEEGLAALFISFGDFHTKKALENPGIMDRINSLGKELHEELKKTPDLNSFLYYSNRFSNSLGLLTPECREVLEFYEKNGLTGGMHFFGNGVFTLTEPDKAETMAESLKSRTKGGRIFVCGVEKEGCHIVSEN